jgi:hypothetical protein
MKTIYHNFGLGDSIICNALVRHFYHKYGQEICIFSYHHNLKNLLYMYRDLKNFHIIGVKSDKQAERIINKHINKKDIIKIQQKRFKIPFDKTYYTAIGLDFSVRFNEFYFQRNIENEILLFNTLNPAHEKFIFVHDNPELGYNINMNKVNKNYKIIMNDKTFLFFDYLTLL